MFCWLSANWAAATWVSAVTGGSFARSKVLSAGGAPAASLSGEDLHPAAMARKVARTQMDRIIRIVRTPAGGLARMIYRHGRLTKIGPMGPVLRSLARGLVEASPGLTTDGRCRW